MLKSNTRFSLLTFKESDPLRPYRGTLSEAILWTPKSDNRDAKFAFKFLIVGFGGGRVGVVL